MNKLYLKIASASSIIAGALHASIVAFQHMEPIPLETIFFIIFGIAQVVLGFLVLKNIKHLNLLFIINGALALLWVLTRTVYTPFMNELEGVGLFDSFVFLLEVLAVLGVLSFYKSSPQDAEETKTNEGPNSFFLIFLSMLVGFCVYGGGVLSEKLFPHRVIVHSHGSGGHHGDDGHHSDEEMDNHHEEAINHHDDDPVDETEPEKDVKKEEKLDYRKGVMDEHHDDEPHGH